MTERVGRNDPCPCGSGKKFKQCCWAKAHQKKKIKAVVIKGGGAKPPVPAMPDLVERTFGARIAELKRETAAEPKDQEGHEK